MSQRSFRLYHVDVEEFVRRLGEERQHWRDAINAYPARNLNQIRKSAGISIGEACKLMGVSVREWAFAERGQNPESAWKLYGAIGGEALGDFTSLSSFLQGAMTSGKLRGKGSLADAMIPLGKRWFARYSDLSGKELGERLRYHRLMRSKLAILRAQKSWSVSRMEEEFGLPDINNIEFRMSDESEFLTWRIEEALKCFVVHGYRNDVIYALEQGGGYAPIQEKSPLLLARLNMGGDIYRCAGLFGMNPKQWWRLENGVFYAEEEKVLRGALLLAMENTSLMAALSDQRERQTPLSSRMKGIRLQAGKGTYAEAARWIARHKMEEQSEGENAAMKRRLGKKRNTRMACHHWGILENGCVPDMSSDEGLKAVGMAFMSGSAWSHYYNKNLRCG